VRHLTVFQLMSADGSRLLGSSFGGFAGTENDEENEFPLLQAAAYRFSRGPAGWGTEALAPPASRFSHSKFVAADGAVQQSLWGVTFQPHSNEELLGPAGYLLAIREPRVGEPSRFVTVGPQDPPPGTQQNFKFEGASPDLRHVAYSIAAGEGALWPGDGTRPPARSLYEYAGTGEQEPVLVGVRNSGPLHGTPHVNEGAELITECGVELGGGERGSTYNAISGDGSIVYFTALHEAGSERCATPSGDEVYARVDGSKTVAISGYKSPECTVACAAAEPKPAVFQGASEDGSKVFFTTSQPLLNSDGDGTNDLYEAELGEAGVERLIQVSRGDATDPTPGTGANVAGVARVSADGSRVYFVARGVLSTTANDHRENAEPGGYNLYVYSTAKGSTAFIATLVTSAEFNQQREALCANVEEGFFKEQCEKRATAETEAIEAERAQAQRGDHRLITTSPDGRYLVFLSERDLTGPEDRSTANQAFEYDAQTARLARVSVGQKSPAFPGGFNSNGNTTNSEDAARILAPNYKEDYPGAAMSAPSVAADGTAVFTSRNTLAPGAVAGGRNVYEYRAGNVYLISPGGDPSLEAAAFGTNSDHTEPAEESGRLLGIDQSGTDVFFMSVDRLVPEDTDSQVDWYDARIDGGFAAPARIPACEGDSCQGPLSAAPAFSSPASASQAGGDNLAPSPTPATGKRLTRAQRLALALKACRRHAKQKRHRCEAQARRRYGPKAESHGRRKGA
jgi:hypothetical protein